MAGLADARLAASFLSFLRQWIRGVFQNNCVCGIGRHEQRVPKRIGYSFRNSASASPENKWHVEDFTT